jgi:peptide/nickel transport system substrate-binding protein
MLKLLAGLTGLMLATGAMAQQKVLTIALPTNVNTLDPHMTASIGTDMSVLSHIYPPLVIRGPDMSIKPSIATSWKAVDDLTWELTLRSDATFADGEKIDATTVKWNLDRVRDPKVNARIAAWFTPIADVTVKSPTLLSIKMKSPYPAFIGQMSMFLILPPKWVESHKPASETTTGGPYMISENVPGDHITLTPNTKYWGDKAQYDRVVFRIIPDPAARVAALLAGEIDFTPNIPINEIKRINATGRANAGSTPSTRTAFIKFNTLKPPMDNKLFRQALNYAIDKEGIVSGIFDGQAQLAQCEVLTKDYFGYNPDLKPYPYDPAKAKQLLQQSGVTNPELEFDVPTATYLNGEEVVQVVASQLAEIGVKTKINEMQFSAYMDKYLKTKELARLSLLTQAWPSLDADGLLALFEGGNIYAYWDDPVFNKALVEGRSTLDEKARMAAYKKATEEMCEQAPVLFLYIQPATYGTSKRLTWKPRGDDWVRAYDMTIK